MKRYLCTLLMLMFLFSLFPGSAYAEFDPNGISTKHVVLMDALTGNILFEKDAYKKAFPASTTKILTCIIALEEGNLDDMVIIGSEVEDRGSTMGIVRREELTLRDLLYGMMLKSGNDAARAIAEHIAGSEKAFADMMNAKAVSIGMTNSHFIRSNGLHEEDHYTTAVDLAILTRYCLKNPDFRTIVGTDVYEVPPTNKDTNGYILENTNKLIYKNEDDSESYLYPYATGVKTGDTIPAGKCLVASAKHDDIELIAVFLGDYEVDGDYRFEMAAKLFNWGFENCCTVQAQELGLQDTFTHSVGDASFEDPDNGNLELHADLVDKQITGLRTYISSLRENISAVTATPVIGELTAPIKQGDKVGIVSYQYEGRILFEADLVATRDVAQIGLHTAPSNSPLITGPKGEPKEKYSSLLFWIIATVVIVVIVVALRLLFVNKLRRRRRTRDYYVYKRK